MHKSAIALTVLATSGVAMAAYTDPLTPIATAGHGLVWHATAAATLAAADAALPNVGVADVLASANLHMKDCANGAGSVPIDPHATAALCWADADEASIEWTPQSVTTSGDADNDGAWGANDVILSAWHYAVAGDRYNETRVAFIAANGRSARAYRWVYLVEAASDGSVTPIKAHAGGMTWYGDKLFVVAVGNSEVALRVFSMKQILKANADSAYGYAYVMPQIGTYTYAGGACSMASDSDVACFSSISLDRSTSPDSLVTTEYFSDAALHGRLFRFSFGADFLLAERPIEALRSSVGNMQGVLSWRGTWWVAHSSATAHGQLWQQTTTASTSATCRNGETTTKMCWSLHPEALSYSPSTGLVWSVTEYPNQRALFALPLSELVSAQATDAGSTGQGDAGASEDDAGSPAEQPAGCNTAGSPGLFVALFALIAARTRRPGHRTRMDRGNVGR